MSDREFSSKVHDLLRTCLAGADYNDDSFMKAREMFDYLYHKTTPNNFMVVQRAAREYNVADSQADRYEQVRTLDYAYLAIRDKGYKTEYDVTEIDCSSLSISDFTSIMHVYNHCKTKSQSKMRGVSDDFFDQGVELLEEMVVMDMKRDWDNYKVVEGLSLDDSHELMASMAAFSFGKDISREAQSAWWRSPRISAIKGKLRDFLHEKFSSLHENPWFGSFMRYTRSVATMHPTAAPMSILNLKKQDDRLLMLAKLCQLYVSSGKLSKLDDPDDTTEVEHLLHQMLVLGAVPDNHLNKCFLRGSAFGKVIFTHRRSTDGGSDDKDFKGPRQPPKGKPVLQMRQIKSTPYVNHSTNKLDPAITEFITQLVSVMERAGNEGVVKTIVGKASGELVDSVLNLIIDPRKMTVDGAGITQDMWHAVLDPDEDESSRANTDVPTMTHKWDDIKVHQQGNAQFKFV
ncbi:hypothetical protein CAPTEDRAFT_198435 [Capitella teleta]|uniref:Uncharacterized protein n=1 Tax=Capitella teleta TaxID=283909 RepID=R7U427_CAPTE|nr:hypothetical protein CAPTEDRAFT_198435 [Capitella teleta]|eukprot:ELT97915.1 hypothetical protein CAPTEDRAFT_198435 [Capitella teleta]